MTKRAIRAARMKYRTEFIFHLAEMSTKPAQIQDLLDLFDAETDRILQAHDRRDTQTGPVSEAPEDDHELE